MRLLVPAVALLAGLLFATSASTADGTDLRGDRRVQLTELIRAEAAEAERREAVAAQLRAEVADAQRTAAERDARVSAQADAAAALAPAVGLTPVEGPSVTVELDDAPRSSRPTDAAPDDLVVHQQDVQAVVNALWAGGAEAMTLMGQRIISTSAVRCVGNTLILQGRVYSPPFVVTAVGDVDGMRGALREAPGVQLYREYVERYGLGYEVSSARSTRLPGYDGALDLPMSTRG